MRETGGTEGKNNNRNPTLREAERAKGVSGEAVHGDKLRHSGGQRKSVTKSSP